MRFLGWGQSFNFCLSIWALGGATLVVVGCAKPTPPEVQNQISCAPRDLVVLAGSLGKANVFFPDPLTRSGSQIVSPTSLNLNEFHIRATLERLSGRGVLEGQYVAVKNGLDCDDGFGAYERGNEFLYDHGDGRFQEAMSYYFGDQYRAAVDSTGYLVPKNPVEIIVHCMQDDNAFFVRGIDSTGQVIERVCLGDSAMTPGASYADDAFVTVHELQHANTVDMYSLSDSLNQFWYDEAGGLNEAISDFMGMIFFEPTLPVSVDPRVFSRWALGTFIPNQISTRGAHKCPTYDPTFPKCGSYPAFSAVNNTVSYIYPDGLSWPYANNFDAPGYLRSVYMKFRSSEEIHNTGILMEGALWDVYEAIKANHGGDSGSARALMVKAVMQAVQSLPKPMITNISPVTFRGFAAKLVDASILLKFQDRDQKALESALIARGLYKGEILSPGWAAASSIGLRVEDNPTVLKKWLLRIGVSPESVNSFITQNLETGLNGRMDPGEVVVVWFDVQNNSVLSAGGVQLTVTSLDEGVTFLGPGVNFGAISATQTQIVYGKIFGTGVLPSLSSANPSFHVPTGNTYFLTNPFFFKNFTTAIWLKVSKDVRHGKTIQFDIRAVASNSNGAPSPFTLDAVVN